MTDELKLLRATVEDQGREIERLRTERGFFEDMFREAEGRQLRSAAYCVEVKEINDDLRRERRAALNDEREACAKVAEETHSAAADPERCCSWEGVHNAIAAAIRAKGTP